MAEVLDVEVSDLLGKKIEVSENVTETEAIAIELAKLNELLVAYGEKAGQIKNSIKKWVAIIIVIFFIAAIYESWGDMWHEFGRNLYHMRND